MSAIITADDVWCAITAKSPTVSQSALLLSVAIFILWVAIVAVGALHHEFWRDEVRALSFALQADSLFSVPSAVQGEGHPALWYILLRAAYDIFGTKAVLPLVSAAIAAVAVLLFLWRAPFPLWWKALFVFSGIPLYEYSVMARNYGISMLLMFLFAVVYTSESRSPLLLGLILFLLANTNIHSALLVPLFVFIWLCDWRAARKRQELSTEKTSLVSLAIVLALTGIFACFFTVYPSQHDLVTSNITRQMPLISALLSAIFNPGQFYDDIGGYPLLPLPVVTVLLYLAVAGLISRFTLLLAGLGGLWANSLLFGLVYTGVYRHQAIWLVYLITLYWIGFTRHSQLFFTKARDENFSAAVYSVLSIMLLLNIGRGVVLIYRDMSHDRSQSYAVGELLRKDNSLNRAIVMAEPDYAIEALPYYVDNDIYLIRESRFRKWALWTKSAKLDLSLADILKTAFQLRNDTGRPVVILLCHPLTETAGEKVRNFTYGWRFRYTPEQLKEFRAATMELASLHGAITDENFEVYLLK